MTADLTHDQAVVIETAEVEAWRDLYRAMPASFRSETGTELVEVGDVALTRSRTIPFVHFNSVLDLGLRAPATEADLDAVVAAYRDAAIPRFYVFHHAFCSPADLETWLSARGFEASAGWDRTYRLGTTAVPAPPPPRGEVVFTTPENASTWAGFIDGWYRLPTSPWLKKLVGRDGWRIAMLLRDGKPAATRSMFVTPGRFAWVGVEAPIPGLMAPSFDDDHVLLHALLGEAARARVELVAGDVESTNQERKGPAYDRWTALGFTIAYHRTHYVHRTA